MRPMSFEPAAGSRRLRDHIGVLRRRALVVVAITLVAALAALGLSLTQPRRYTATAQVLFQQDTATVQDPRPDQIVDSKRLDPVRVMQNEVRLASSELVRERAQGALGRPVSGSVTNVRDSDVLLFSARAATPDDAATAANAWADAYTAVRADLSASRTTASSSAIDAQLDAIDSRLAGIDRELDAGPGAERAVALDAERAALIDQRAAWVRQQQVLAADIALASTNDARVIDRADPPRHPSQPATLRNLLLAVLVGLVLGLGTGYAVDELDDAIRNVDDLARALTLPVIGAASTLPTSGDVRVVPADDPALIEAGVAPLAPPETGTGRAQVLVVPRGSRGRQVRERATALDRLGVHLVGAVLALGEGDASAGSTPDLEGSRRLASQATGGQLRT